MVHSQKACLQLYLQDSIYTKPVQLSVPCRFFLKEWLTCYPLTAADTLRLFLAVENPRTHERKGEIDWRQVGVGYFNS